MLETGLTQVRVEVDKTWRDNTALCIYEGLSVHRRGRPRNSRDDTTLHDDVADSIEGPGWINDPSADNTEATVHDPGSWMVSLSEPRQTKIFMSASR
jgi:hypothetical protein